MTNRPLTPEEQKAIWALNIRNAEFYTVINNEVYITDALGIDVFDIKGNPVCDSTFNDNCWHKNSSPIPRKPFDIKSHVFSDSIANIKATNNAGASIVIDAFGEWIDINKQDIINKFKALGLTVEDLK